MPDRPKRAAVTRSENKKEESKSAQRPAKAQKQAKGQSASQKSKDETKSEANKAEEQDHGDPKGNGTEEASGEPDSKGQAKAGSNVEKRIESLLKDDIFAIAYPPIEPGHGEVDMPADAPTKPRPKPDMPKQQKNGSGKQRDYTSPDLTPFEQLLCAMLLSKPISHRLGLRTIQTILSAPYSMRTPAALLDDAGYEGRRAAMWDARTQHKEKTAAQLGDAVKDLRKLSGASKDDDTSKDEDVNALKAVLEAAQKEKDVEQAAEAVRKMLAPNVKGLGPTGVDIFLRGVQGDEKWSKALYPFMDKRTVDVAHRLGLLDKADTDPLKAAKTLADGMPKNKSNPRDFVRLVDTLIGIDLEKQTEEISKRLG